MSSAFRSFAPSLRASMLCLVVCLLFARALHAHPVVRGNFDVLVDNDRVRLAATVAMEEVLLAGTLGSENVPASMDEALQRHGQYILKHVSLHADDRPLPGRLLSSAIIKQGVESVRFEFEFLFGKTANAPPPRNVRIGQAMLNDVKAPTGEAWEAAYVLSVGMKNGARVEGLLARDKPVTFTCAWTPQPGEPAPAASFLFPAAFISIAFAVLAVFAHLLERRKNLLSGGSETGRRRD